MNQPTFAFSPQGATSVTAPVEPSPMAEAVSDGASPPPASRSWMGFTPVGLLLILLALLTLAWGAWATREILEIRDRKIVSVSLTSMMKQFVAAESRRPQSQNSARTRTLAFLQGVEGSIQALAADGHVVLLSEAVAGNSVPDATPAVMAAVANRMANLPVSGEPESPAPDMTEEALPAQEPVG